MDAFVARQPIFDRSRQLYGYELLFRSAVEQTRFDSSDGTEATTQVLANSLLSIGLENIVGDKKAFVNFNRDLLLGDSAKVLPPHILVVEVLETVASDAEVLAACRSLQKLGYAIALDDFVMDEGDPLVGIANIIKVDLRVTSRRTQEDLLQHCRPRGIALLAEKVETHEEFEWARHAGFDYFQGYFFARPTVMHARSIPSSNLSCLRLLSEMRYPELRFSDLAKIIDRDVSLSYKLLRYANSARFNFRFEVREIVHALAVMGDQGIRHWVALATLPVLSENKPDELITHSAVRARFCELVAQAAGSADTGSAFLMGLFSLLDTLLSMPLADALGQLSLSPAISGALLNGASEDDRFQCTYQLVLHYERADWPEVLRLSEKLGVKAGVISQSYADAVLWARQGLAATGRRANTRRQVRFDTDAKIRVLWMDEAGRERYSTARLCNVSVTGIQIHLPEKLPVLTSVSCNEPKVGISGRGSVRYCNFSRGGYLIGLEFSNGTGWKEPLPRSSKESARARR